MFFPSLIDLSPLAARCDLGTQKALIFDDTNLFLISSALVGCSAEEEGEATWLQVCQEQDWEATWRAVPQEQDGAEDGFGQAEGRLA